MSKIFLEIFDPARLKTFNLLKYFKRVGVLAGGTAIALQIKHRKSFDFDVFLKNKPTISLVKKIKKVFGYGLTRTKNTENQITFISRDEIGITFVGHPYPNLHPLVKTDSINLFDLKDLASNKAYTIGKRGMWRDYVDLFFIIKGGYTNLTPIIDETEKRFGSEFNARLFLEQLIYTKDMVDFGIDFIGKKYKLEEVVSYFKLKIKEYSEKKIKTYLKRKI